LDVTREETTMRVFLAGGSGAIGRRLVPMLVEAGHEVTATTRSAAKEDALRRAGAKPVALDVLDRDAVMRAVTAARPEVVIHQVTALSGMSDLRKFDEEFRQTNELRTRGADNLVAAARECGARRFVAQSFGGWPYAREGGPVKSEDDPLDPDPPQQARRTLDAIRHLERVTTGTPGIDGIALRYGFLYGPGTSLDPAGKHPQIEAIRNRRFPIIGRGQGIWSFVHVDDAASAALAAVDRGRPGVYNIVDDHPAPVAEWLPYLAELLGAKPPRHAPAWVGRLVVGEHGVAWMTEIRGASNEKAKRELGWQPLHPDWREGFRAVLQQNAGKRVA
jgi:nucleoside-diphosphate-sugar epimerase